jgi:hypothetical protein
VLSKDQAEQVLTELVGEATTKELQDEQWKVRLGQHGRQTCCCSGGLHRLLYWLSRVHAFSSLDIESSSRTGCTASPSCPRRAYLRLNGHQVI